ncbi:MAG: N-acetyltransferase [Isosphaeraceae bacterium]|jgi:GNAT superfamily N-acetyltransferase|nr:MAG: N-acetyltransferase [Isosphaeraceae bacterium]
MAVSYFKRFRMEIDLEGNTTPVALPEGYRWVAWSDQLLDLHAELKYLSFRNELDSLIFPCLGEREGCRRLMGEIRRKPGFLPSATWAIAAPEGCVATIQGVVDQGPIGAIQNVGVIPGYRGLGLGRALVRQALGGFAAAGLRRAYLEVTADNHLAVRLYRSLGFRRSRTLYKAIDYDLEL